MVVRTFIDNTNLNGKTVIPFTTSGGSGLANTREVLEKAYPKAHVRKGFTVEGETVKSDPNTVKTDADKWLNQLGY